MTIHNILPPVVDEKSELLILGSMPGRISLDRQQYYGNERNHFWSILTTIFDEPIPEKYEERLAFLLHHKISLWDTIASCERQGSLDSAIKKEIPNDFAWLFEQYPQIRKVLFNGGKAEQVFKKYYKQSGWPHIEFIRLPSTSPVPGKNVKSYDEKLVLWKEAIQK